MMAKTVRTKKKSTTTTWITLSFLVTLCFFPANAHSTNYVRICALDREEEAVKRDPVTGDYVLMNDHNSTSNSSRNLLRGSFSAAMMIDTTAPQRLLEQTTNDDDILYFVRKCSCFSPHDSTNDTASYYYCPTDKDICGLTKESGEEPIGCFKYSARTNLMRSAWPVVILWYGALFVFLLLAERGRYARQYVLGNCCGDANDRNVRFVEQVLSISDEQQQQAPMQRIWRQRRRRFAGLILMELESLERQEQQYYEAALHGGAPTELALKTKRYSLENYNKENSTNTKKEQNNNDNNNNNDNGNDNDDDEGHSCTICFAPIEDGDRVGALACNHTFHVDCLKSWLPRRNACPLCQAPNVAIPRTREERTETSNNNDQTASLQQEPQQESQQQGL